MRRRFWRPERNSPDSSTDDPEIIRAYTLIDTHSRRLPTGAIKMGKNDLWIAATANALNAVIVTTDRDFDHLHGGLVMRLRVR